MANKHKCTCSLYLVKYNTHNSAANPTYLMRVKTYGNSETAESKRQDKWRTVCLRHLWVVAERVRCFREKVFGLDVILYTVCSQFLPCSTSVVRPESKLWNHWSALHWVAGKSLWSTSGSVSWWQNKQMCFIVYLIKKQTNNQKNPLPVHTCDKAHDWLMSLAGVMVDIDSNYHQVFLLKWENVHHFPTDWSNSMNIWNVMLFQKYCIHFFFFEYDALVSQGTFQ